MVASPVVNLAGASPRLLLCCYAPSMRRAQVNCTVRKAIGWICVTTAAFWSLCLLAQPTIQLDGGYCTACHGAASKSEGAPGLCGADADWIAERMLAYREQGNSVMSRLGAGLTESEVRQLSQAAAKLYDADGPFCRAIGND